MLIYTIIQPKSSKVKKFYIIFAEIYFKIYNVYMKLKEFRVLKGLTRKEVAENLNITVNSIEKYENGKAEPSIANLIKLARLFGVSVDTLIGNDAEIVDLTTLDEDRKYVVKKVARELKDVEVGQIIGVMKTFK